MVVAGARSGVLSACLPVCACSSNFNNGERVKQAMNLEEFGEEQNVWVALSSSRPKKE